jgi:outer membrane lipoprotein-sorting protein
MKRLSIFWIIVSHGIVGFCALALNCQAQNFNEDYKKVFNTYATHRQLSLEMTYTIYNERTGNEVVETREGLIKMDGKKLFQTYLNTDNLENSPYHLFVDHKRKLVILTEKTASQLKTEKKAARVNKPDLTFSIIDSSLANVKNITYEGTIGNIKQYRITPKIKGQREISIAINTSGWVIQKLTMYAEKPIHTKNITYKSPRLEITYRNINLKPVFRKNEFDLANYGTFIKGKFTLANNYKTYKLAYKRT